MRRLSTLLRVLSSDIGWWLTKHKGYFPGLGSMTTTTFFRHEKVFKTCTAVEDSAHVKDHGLATVF